jgi:hypothetical protein
MRRIKTLKRVISIAAVMAAISISQSAMASWMFSPDW